MIVYYLFKEYDLETELLGVTRENATTLTHNNIKNNNNNDINNMAAPPESTYFMALDPMLRLNAHASRHPR